MTASPLEKTIVRRITTELKKRHIWHVKTVGGHGRAGLPDLLICHRGRFVALEVKRPGCKATPLQAATLAKIEAAGGLAGVAHSWDEAKEVLGL